jgi:hypothetical protein
MWLLDCVTASTLTAADGGSHSATRSALGLPPLVCLAATYASLSLLVVPARASFFVPADGKNSSWLGRAPGTDLFPPQKNYLTRSSVGAF